MESRTACAGIRPCETFINSTSGPISVVHFWYQYYNAAWLITHLLWLREAPNMISGWNETYWQNSQRHFDNTILAPVPHQHSSCWFVSYSYKVWYVARFNYSVCTTSWPYYLSFQNCVLLCSAQYPEELRLYWTFPHLTLYVQHQSSVPTQQVVYPLCSEVESKGGVVDGRVVHLNFMQETRVLQLMLTF